MFDSIKRLIIGKNDHRKKLGASKNKALDQSQDASSSSLMKSNYQVTSCLSPGIERSHNEDALFTLTAALDGLETSATFGLYLVADGMGGHQSGELASRFAVKAASKFLIDQVFNAYIYDHQSFTDEKLSSLVSEAVDEAQKLVQRKVPGGGTTLTLVMGVGDRFFSAHVGDSRLYIIDRDGRISLKTKDHSLVKRLVDLGEITEEQAGSHPQRNLLYRALGQSDPFEPDIDQFSMQPGDSLLICSDGLWGVIPEERISKIINGYDDLEGCACALVDAANQAGGPDNISVVLVKRTGS